jgi:hypothetical protein
MRNNFLHYGEGLDPTAIARQTSLEWAGRAAGTAIPLALTALTRFPRRQVRHAHYFLRFRVFSKGITSGAFFRVDAPMPMAVRARPGRGCLAEFQPQAGETGKKKAAAG